MAEIEKKRRSIQGIKATIFDDRIWVFDRWINALFSMDIKTGKTEYVLSIEQESKYKEALISHIVYYDNKLFLNPGTAKSGILVDLKTMVQREIPLNRKGNPSGVKNANIVQKDSVIYMLPKWYGDPVLIYDFIKDEIAELQIDYKFVKENQINVSEFVWGSGCRTQEGYCLIMTNTPGILYLRDNGEWNYYKADTSNVGFVNCIANGNDIYLLPYKGKDIMVFHMNNKKFEKVIFPRKIVCEGDAPYATIAIIKEKLALFPSDEKNIIIYDLKTQKMILHYIGDARYNDCKVYGDEIYGFPYVGDDIIVININTNKIKKLNMLLPDTYKEKRFADYWLYEIPCLEGEKYLHSEKVISKQDFIENIINSKMNNIENTENDNYGSIIWKNILLNKRGDKL